MPVYAQTNSKLESRDSSLSPLTAQQWLMDGLPNQPMQWSNSARAGSSRLLNFAGASASKPHPIQRCCSISHLHLVHRHGRHRRKECSCKSTAPLFFDHTDSWNACRFFSTLQPPMHDPKGFRTPRMSRRRAISSTHCATNRQLFKKKWQPYEKWEFYNYTFLNARAGIDNANWKATELRWWSWSPL